MLEPRTVANAYVRSLLATAKARGVAPDVVLRGLPVDEHTLSVPNGRVSVSLVNLIWRRALELSGDSALGLKMAEAMTPSSFRVVGLAVMSCASLEQAVSVLLRYQRLVSEAGTLSTRPATEGAVELIYTPQRMRVQLLPQQVEAVLGGIVTQAKWLAGGRLAPVAVAFRHARQAAPEDYRRVFGADPVFDADLNRLTLTAEFLHTALPQADAELCRMHCELADQALARLPQIGFIAGFALQWLQSRASGTVRIGDLARALGLSVRSLQRQLDAEDASWSELVDRARRDALEDLLSRGVTLDDAAGRLGYHDASSLSRAARRWFGTTPGRWLAKRRR